MNKKEIKIIPAEIKHAKALGMLLVSAWQKAYKDIVPQKILNSFSNEQRTQAFYKAIQEKTEITYICMLDNVVAGFVTLGKCRDSDVVNAGEIWGIYLDPKYWRKGLGTVLANWAINYLTQSQIDKIAIWVFRDNFPSRKFYESIEFKEDGQEKKLEKLNAIAVRYIKYVS